MRKWLVFSVLSLVVALTMVGLGFHVQAAEGGKSSHQAPDSPDRRTLELRDMLETVQQFTLTPPRDPSVIVRNRTNQSIRVQLSGGTVFTLEPNSRLIVELMPGSFRYEAQVAGFPPLAGSATFQKNTEYSWVFSYTRP